MTAAAPAVEAPTMADAALAAEALVAGGAEEVLLFGSVARGDAGEGSDIDLVALFADIDIERALADELVEDYTNTALAVCEFTISNIADRLGDTAAMRQATAEWRRRATFIATRNVRTGLPHD